jgi:hypothetical protein
VAQLQSRVAYNYYLVERVIRYLQTKDAALFPFTESMTPEQRRAFQRDLRDGLAELQDSGSARKTSAVGYIMSDDHLRDVIDAWERGQPASQTR